jgi:hypothetical protein
MNDLLAGIYKKNKIMSETIKLYEELHLLKLRQSSAALDRDDVDITGDDDPLNEGTRDSVRRSTSTRRGSVNTRLLSMMMKNKEKFSAPFREYISQQRMLLGCKGVLFPKGYKFKVFTH